MPTVPNSVVRLVTDTNIVVSALIWGGLPKRIISAGFGKQVALISTDMLLAELWSVLSRPKFSIQIEKRGTTAYELFSDYAETVLQVAPSCVEPVIIRDPADDHVLAAALAGHADFIVSGDADLLDLGSYRGIPIVTAREAVERLALA